MAQFVRTLFGLLAPAAILALLAIAPASAGDALRPDVPKAAAGTSCVREPDFMRRNHMSMLTHKRDLTVHEGDRTPEASLKECVTCHAVAGDDGQPVKVSDPRHFCRACHDYAAVKVDCFQCHASRPETSGAAALDGAQDAEIAALSAYLKGVAQ